MALDTISKNKDLEKMTGDVIVTALLTENVDTVFGIVGSHVVGIYDALRQTPEIRSVSARHESSVTFMATGFARITGQVGVAIVTAGPGILNAMNGIGQACFSGLPLVVIAGGPPNKARPFELHTLQKETYCIETLAPLVKYVGRPKTVGNIGVVLSKAIAVARSGRPGPVYVEIPWDLFQSQETTNLPYISTDVMSYHYDEDDIARAGKALGKVKDKLIVIDKGILHDPDSGKIITLAENIGAGLCVTRDALGMVDETHPLYRGVMHDHMFGPYGIEAVKNADLCLLFGFDPESDNHHRVLTLAQNFVIMMGPGKVTSAGLSLNEACDRLGAGLCSQDASYADISHINNKRHLISRINQNPEENLYLKTLVELQGRMKKNDISIVDAGNNEVWARTILPVMSELSCLGGANWASMGYALPTAIAARVAAPERRVVCTTGDGCLLMSLMDLSTFFDVGGPSILVVLNDSEYGMMSDVQVAQYGASYDSSLPQVNFVDLAMSMGGAGYHITSMDDIIPAVEKAMSSHTPIILDVVCGRPPSPTFAPMTEI